MSEVVLQIESSHACFAGEQRFYSMQSEQLGLPARFAVHLPPKALKGQACSAVLYLAGLTCTPETAVIKAGAQRVAAELGQIMIFPDTSPRGANIEGEDTDWDFGTGAGFYIDAKATPWATHYRMESFLILELLPLLKKTLPIDAEKVGIMGHSMGGHGALTLALKYPTLFKSVSAFAPICAPTQCPWGHKAFSGYLGSDRTMWAEHDATELMKAQSTPPYPKGILIDQGTADNFLKDQLHPELFAKACESVGQTLDLRMHEGYDHGYYFISTFMQKHLEFHSSY